MLGIRSKASVAVLTLTLVAVLAPSTADAETARSAAPRRTSGSLTASTAAPSGAAVDAASSAAGQPACADVLFVGARGSGNKGPGTPGWVPTSSDPYGLGGTVNAVRQYLVAGLGARRSMATMSVDYPANAVTTLPFRADVYFAGLSSGELWVENTLAARNCPGEAIVLSGFSQGAMVLHRALLHWIAVNSSIKDRVAAAVLVGDGDRVPNDNTIIDGFASPGKQGIGLDWTSQSGSSWTRFPAALHDKIIEVCEPDDLVCDQPSTSIAALNTHLGYSTSSASIRLAGAQSTLRVLDVPRTSPVSWCFAKGANFAAQLPVDVLGGATLEWRLQPGSSLPPGVTLAGGGTITGTRTTTTAWTSVIEVRNTLPTPDTAWISLTITFTSGCSTTSPNLVRRASATVGGSMRLEDAVTWTFPLTNTGDGTWTASQVIVNVVTPSGAGYLVPCAGGTNVSVASGRSWTCTASMDIAEFGVTEGTLFWQTAGGWYNQVPTSPWTASATVTEGPLTGTGTTVASTTVTTGGYTTLTSTVRNDARRTMTFQWIDYYVEDPEGFAVYAACQSDTNITLAPGQSWSCDAGFRAEKRGTYRGWLRYRLPSGAVYFGPHPAGSDRTWTSASIPSVGWAEPGTVAPAGGQIALHGKNLDGATSVTFGGTPGHIVGGGGDPLFVDAPPHAPGSVPIVVTAPDGSSEPLLFEYRGPGAPVKRASLSAGGAQANAASRHPSISTDGVWVAFESTASNLVAGDTNGLQDVFLRNTVTGSIIRVTDNPFRGQADGASRNPSVSGDGQMVAFESDATDLWNTPTTSTHVWVRQVSTGGLFPMDLSIRGGPATGSATDPSIANSGRVVAFVSNATDILTGDTRPFGKVFVRDLDGPIGAETVEASTNAAGVPANGPSSDPAISGDGKVVAFKSWATNLVPNDGGAHHPGLYVKQLATGAISRVDVSDTGAPSNGTSLSAPSIGYSGIYVAFSTNASNLDAGGDTNGVNDVYQRTVNVGNIGVFEFTWRVSLKDDLTESRYASHDPVVAPNENGVLAFAHDGSDLGAQSGSSTSQIYVRDGWNDVATLTAVGSVSAGSAARPALSWDGSSVAFDSDAPDLVPGDGNGVNDVFVASPSHEGPPAQVTDVTAIPSSGHAVLSWSGASSSHQTVYLVRFWSQAVGGTEIAPFAVSYSPSVVVGDLTDGRTYYAEVTAANAKGDAAPSARVPVTPRAVVPEAPIDVTLGPLVRVPPDANGDGDGRWSVDVSWDEPSSSPDVGFIARAFTQPSSGQLVGSAGVAPNGPRTGQLVLEAGRTSYVEVVATNAIGESAPSTPIAVTAPAVPSWAPLEPTAVPGNASATVSWHAPLYTGGAPISRYTVTASPGGRTCAATTTSCQVSGLTNGTTYTFTVRARTAAGLGAKSSTVSATPGKPSAPRYVSATADVSAASVSFTSPASTGGATITGYTVTASPGGKTATGTTSPIAVSGLTPGTPYTFTVTATTSLGTSAPSSPSVPITVLAARYGVRFSDADLAQINAAADAFAIPRPQALISGARLLRFLDALSAPTGLGRLTPPVTSAGPGSLTAEYTDPAEVRAMEDLASRTGVTVSQLHDIGAHLIVFFWYLSTH